MIAPCEIAVKSAVPAIKALIAKELVKKHGLRQDEVAVLLGISQSAVSKYTRKVRGYVIRVDEIDGVDPMIEKIVALVAGGTYQRGEFLEIFCQICATIRKTRLMCQFCQQADPNIKTEDCNFCMNPNLHHK